MNKELFNTIGSSIENNTHKAIFTYKSKSLQLINKSTGYEEIFTFTTQKQVNNMLDIIFNRD